MAIEDLAPQMPSEEPTSSDENTVYADAQTNGEQTDSTPVNESFNNETPMDNPIEGLDPKGRAQSRIKELTKARHSLEVEKSALEAEVRTLRESTESSGQTTLEDLSIDELEGVLDNEEYSEHHNKVQRILRRKYAEDVVNQRMAAQTADADEQSRRAMSYQLAEVVAGKDAASNADHPLTLAASAKYDILSQNVGDLTDNPTAYALAYALAKIDELQSAVATPQVNPAVDRRARIEASTRSAAAPIGNIKETLHKYSEEGLRPSSQGRTNGSLREVLKQSAVIKSFKET